MSSIYARQEKQNHSVDKIVERTSNLDTASRQILFDYIKNGEYIIQHRLKMRVLVDKTAID